MTVAKSVLQSIENASWIRRMFEAGKALKEIHGDDNVFDFSLGNPVLEPPAAFEEALRELANNPPAGMHRYMSNNGLAETRAAVAEVMSEQEGVDLVADDVVMTSGAAGGLNVALKSLLNPNEEVIILSPYFVEYGFYTRNAGGIPRFVDTKENFDLDIAAIDGAISDKTKVILINTPNNPTGKIYTQAQMDELTKLLARRERELGTTIYLLSDTPYAKITFDGLANPKLLGDHPNSIMVHSHSKDLGLAGERIGYLLVNPGAGHREDLRAAFSFNNRTLGFIHAPAMMQYALRSSLRASIDVEHYRELREILCQGLRSLGLEFETPQGAFYLFPKTPIADDVEFCRLAQEHQLLLVPGSGFGRAGHVRIAYCVHASTLTRAMPHFENLLARFK